MSEDEEFWKKYENVTGLRKLRCYPHLGSCVHVSWVCDCWFLGICCKWKKFHVKCNWPLFNTMSSVSVRNLSLSPSDGSTPTFECLSQMISEQKPSELQNGLTKCKRHVITNQDEKCQTTINVRSCSSLAISKRPTNYFHRYIIWKYIRWFSNIAVECVARSSMTKKNDWN